MQRLNNSKLHLVDEWSATLPFPYRIMEGLPVIRAQSREATLTDLPCHMNVRATASMSKKNGSVNAGISKARISIEDGAE